MDSFNITHLKAVKAKAIRKHRKIEKITNMFRLLEILVVLTVVSSFSVHLPIAAKISSEYFKDAALALASPRFVFVVGNLIVIVLFAKSGQLPGQDGKEKRSKKSDLYEEFVEMSGKIPPQQPSSVEQRAETEHRRKQSKSTEIVVKKEASSPVSLGIVKSYERSQSEKLATTKSIVIKPEKELKRSVTEKLVDKKKKGSFPEDNMSSEEFKSTIEAFIERQKRFRIDEEVSVFVG
ncbi:unnamed protein product [Linum tenue]|uniref:DUF4408 domain-containing protein n=1 Tax=Linum tenue TaxID=586396 RepID=A0AAV0LWP0_9ROSI|nr:unnamed protein product [Linum tenue]